jgi:hypothetical protein
MFRQIRFGPHQTLDPFRGSKDIGVKREIIFPVCYSEELPAFFIVHRSPKAPCEKSQLLIRRLLTHGARPPVRLSTSFANPLLFPSERVSVAGRRSMRARLSSLDRSFSSPTAYLHRLPRIAVNSGWYRRYPELSRRRWRSPPACARRRRDRRRGSVRRISWGWLLSISKNFDVIIVSWKDARSLARLY